MEWILRVVCGGLVLNVSAMIINCLYDVPILPSLLFLSLPPSVPLSPSLSCVCGHDCCIVNWLVFKLLPC